MAHILMTARHPGAFNALLPVYNELREQDHSLDVLAGEVAYERFRDVHPSTVHSETAPTSQGLMDILRTTARIITDTPPRVIVTGTASSDYGIDEAATIVGSVLGIPVLTVQDYWATMQVTPFHLLITPTTHYAVMDEEAKRIMAKNHNIPPSNVIVTGQPAFDKYQSFPSEEV